MKLTKYLSFETGSASPKATMIGMTIAASVLLILAILATRMAYVFDTAGERVQAEVVRYIDDGDEMHQAVFQFDDRQGQTHAVPNILKSSRRSFEIGEKVRIVYDENDLAHVRQDRAFWLYFAPAMLGLMSLLFYAGAALVWRFRSRFQRDYEARRGQTIVTVANSDGSATQKSYSSVPVFRWTGVFISGLGTVAWLGAIALISQAGDANGRGLAIGLSVFFFLLGSLLLLGGAALRRGWAPGGSNSQTPLRKADHF